MRETKPLSFMFAVGGCSIVILGLQLQMYDLNMKLVHSFRAWSDVYLNYSGPFLDFADTLDCFHVSRP